MIRYIVEYANTAMAHHPIHYAPTGVWVELEDDTFRAFDADYPKERRKVVAKVIKQARWMKEDFFDYLQQTTSAYIAGFGEILATGESLPGLIKRLQTELDIELSEPR